jgi:hypothetical protein
VQNAPFDINSIFLVLTVNEHEFTRIKENDGLRSVVPRLRDEGMTNDATMTKLEGQTTLRPLSYQLMGVALRTDRRRGGRILQTMTPISMPKPRAHSRCGALLAGFPQKICTGRRRWTTGRHGLHDSSRSGSWCDRAAQALRSSFIRSGGRGHRHLIRSRYPLGMQGRLYRGVCLICPLLDWLVPAKENQRTYN